MAAPVQVPYHIARAFWEADNKPAEYCVVHFSTLLASAFIRGDADNRARLASAYPLYEQAWRSWYRNTERFYLIHGLGRHARLLRSPLNPRSLRVPDSLSEPTTDDSELESEWEVDAPVAPSTEPESESESEAAAN